MISTKIIGDSAEKLAESFLEREGFNTLARNWRCRWGEIDLIVWNKKVLVFVEVRQRQSSSHGGALQSVDVRKQKKLWATAQSFLQQHAKWQQCECRFDVIAIEGSIIYNNSELHWITNAFELS